MITAWLAVSLPRSVSQCSVPLRDGIQNVVFDIEESFGAKNPKAVKDTLVLLPEQVRKAIATGVFEGGGRQYPWEDEAKEATNILLNRITDTCHQITGGSLSWDAIIMTGGGSALLYQRLLRF